MKVIGFYINITVCFLWPYGIYEIEEKLGWGQVTETRHYKAILFYNLINIIILIITPGNSERRILTWRLSGAINAISKNGSSQSSYKKLVFRNSTFSFKRGTTGSHDVGFLVSFMEKAKSKFCKRSQNASVLKKIIPEKIKMFLLSFILY